jgi:hypothetical protein
MDLNSPLMCRDRRRFLLRGAALCTGMAFGLEGRANQNAEPAPESELRDFITPETQRAIDRGLHYLCNSQNRDGSYGERLQWHGNVAVTSLAGLAMMSGGHLPGRGVCGTNVQRALQYVLTRESPDIQGFLHQATGNRQVGMYDHGFATLFLAEVYGMVPDSSLQEQLRKTIERAVRLIEASQSREGGWRYEPIPNQADVSVTICQIMALRAARNAGFFVNHDVVKKCLKYVRSCQNADGGYSYYSGQPGSAFARSAAGLVALYSAGVYDGKEIERTLRYLAQFKPNLPLSRREIPDIHWYYGQYYAAQAMWTAAARFPQYWNDWYPAIRDELLARVRGRSDGSWSDSMTCNHYATAMALIILQIPNNYLPILQK